MACLTNCCRQYESFVPRKITLFSFTCRDFELAAIHLLQARFPRCVAGLFKIDHGVRLLRFALTRLLHDTNNRMCFISTDVLTQPSGCILCVGEDGSFRWIDVGID